MPQPTEYLFPRRCSEEELEEIVFDDKTLKELRATIDGLIAKHGEDVYVKETCQPHDNYQFALFKKHLESEADWKARWEKDIQRKKKLLDDRIAAQQAERKALEDGAPR